MCDYLINAEHHVYTLSPVNDNDVSYDF